MRLFTPARCLSAKSANRKKLHKNRPQYADGFRYNDSMPTHKGLTDQQRRVLFEGDTETPFSGKLLHNKAAGSYLCVNCGTKLFDSETKFDSGSGWPSFYNVASNDAVRVKEDISHDMRRIQVSCANCGGHLGHVFNDAPDQPTGLRFCVNSTALEFRKRRPQ